MTSPQQQQQQPRSGRQMVFVRQSVVGHVTEEEELQALVVVQDQTLVDVEQLFGRINYGSLAALYLVDCHLEHLGDGDSDIVAHLPLTCLVLSHNHLRRIPRSVFQLAGLRILKVDNNRLAEIPSDLEKLSSLETFCCDRQRPRLRCLPSSIQTLRRLRVLSFADNRVDDVSWVVRLTSLRTLICRRNRIRCLPEEIVHLAELQVLDISDNCIRGLHHSFTSLMRRLYRFEYSAASLRPRYAVDDREKLLFHLELEQFLDTRTGCLKQQFSAVDLTVAVVGESFAGKTTLVEALKTDRGTHRQDGRHHKEADFDVHHFGVSSSSSSPAVDASSSCQHGCLVSAVVMSKETLDGFCRGIRVDLFLLVVDLASLELRRGGHQLVRRHLGRFQMWLTALYELCPDTPVLIVGTHAESVKPFVLVEIWKTLEGIMGFGRFHHGVRFASERCRNCILCQPASSSVRHPYLKTRNSSGGFVDISAWQMNPPTNNEHISTDDDDAINSTEKMKLPHVVGYYEVDSRKVFPKDGKKTNTSVDHLKAALLRFAVASNRPRVPAAWVSFLRNIASIRDKLPNLPCIPTADVVALARSFEISTSQVPLMLRYMNERGKALFFDGDPVLSKVVVLDVSWFARAVGRLLGGCAQSSVNRNGILDVLTDPELDRQLRKCGGVAASVSGAEWLLRATQRLGLCVPILNHRERMFIPDLLELGSPSPSFWPEIPDWEERQITCEIVVRTLRPSFFADLVVQVNRLGRRTLQILSDPLPVYLANHIVFHTNLDGGGCRDCSVIRRRMRRTELCDPDDNDDGAPDDPVHKVHIALAPGLTALSVQVRGRSPCCVVKATIEFLELHIEDSSEMDHHSDVICSYREARATCRNGYGGLERCSRSETKCSLSSVFSIDFEEEEEEDEGRLEVHLLCPKCVLLRNQRPERIRCPVTMSRRRAICSKWHNLGSWNRVYTGDYRHTSLDISVPPGLTSLSEEEHPRLLLLLPPSKNTSVRDWYLYRRMKFLEGLELHFLCEFTGFWHLTDDPGYRLTRSGSGSHATKSSQLPVIVQLALPLIQVLQGVGEHPQNARLLAPVIPALIRTYEYLQNTDRRLQADPCAWLAKHKDRVVSMLTKTLMNASEGGGGPNDVYAAATASASAAAADAVFQAPRSVASSRRLLARFLRVEFSSGRFGSLRPVYVGNDVRWVCETHYEELRTYAQNNRS